MAIQRQLRTLGHRYAASDSRSRKLLLVAGGLAVSCVITSLVAHWEPRLPGDLHLTLLLQTVHSHMLEQVMEWVSSLAGWEWPGALLVLTGGIVVWRVMGKFEGCLVLATGPVSLVHLALKTVVSRPRPTPDLVRIVDIEHGSSFPSGHAFFAMLFWGLVAYLAFANLPRRRLRVLILSACLMMILSTGVSRVYLGVHWSSDVLGGYMCGALFLAVMIWLQQEWRAHAEDCRPDREIAGGRAGH